jgi:DNA-binding transcriptional ArsR family regulator
MKNECSQNNSRKQRELQAVKDDFEVLNDANRLRILCLLKEYQELCVCEIYEALDLSQNLASYHLGKLKDAGFVVSRKEGVKVLYRQGAVHIEQFQKLIKLFIN